MAHRRREFYEDWGARISILAGISPRPDTLAQTAHARPKNSLAHGAGHTFLAVQRVERDDGAVGDAEFGEQRLCRRDLVGFLGDIDMGEHEGRIGGKSAEHLNGGTVVEVVEAPPKRFAVYRNA